MMSLRATASRIATAATCGAGLLLAPVVMISMGGSALAQQLDAPIEEQVRANEEGAESQKRVEQVASATDSLIAEYRLTNKKIESLKIFNRQLSAVIRSQDEELESLQRQIDGVEEVGRAVTPLMLEMIDVLDKFVALDIPFLAEERKSRIDSLRVLMRRSDVADAERYRRILEAYQIENDYGRTIDSTPGTIEKGGEKIPVDFLRIGRIGLIYQTRDGEEVGVWQKNESGGGGEWVQLDSGDYSNWISEGLRVAKKQAAPQLIRVPLPRPVKGGNS